MTGHSALAFDAAFGATVTSFPPRFWIAEFFILSFWPFALNEMLGAGWQTVTYRQNTELMIEAWHWNIRGTWSNPAKQEGYFVGSPEPTDQKIMHYRC